MTYVDGFVLAVPKSKTQAYKKMAQEAGKVWKKHGALQYLECMGDDMHPNMPMKIQNFPKMAKAKPSEKVWYSFIIYKSKAHRDAVNKKVMTQMKKDMDHKDMVMPFDVKRMAYGGFKALVDL